MGLFRPHLDMGAKSQTWLQILIRNGKNYTPKLLQNGAYPLPLLPSKALLKGGQKIQGGFAKISPGLAGKNWSSNIIYPSSFEQQ
jgi:hypothetical protein